MSSRRRQTCTAGPATPEGAAGDVCRASGVTVHMCACSKGFSQNTTTNKHVQWLLSICGSAAVHTGLCCGPHCVVARGTLLLPQAFQHELYQATCFCKSTFVWQLPAGLVHSAVHQLVFVLLKSLLEGAAAFRPTVHPACKLASKA
jgi:hypothetical protein